MQKSGGGGGGGGLMAWNVFKFCTALRALGSIMMVLVIGIIGVTYYVVVIADYGPAVFHGGLDAFTSFIVLLLFHYLSGISFQNPYEDFYCYFTYFMLQR
ncbi:hypothetical protein RCOM_1680880 [Ricinus communis]|uniref:Uncharacterized protein n=1 Tax=Ricinus communis TaxID=3988 RepID=B9RBT4_RICCO|nr:hypothetical protein RCOM_1680880 [Ricinus communis]